jgi:hypothetical protein
VSWLPDLVVLHTHNGLIVALALAAFCRLRVAQNSAMPGAPRRNVEKSLCKAPAFSGEERRDGSIIVIER